MTKLHPLGRKAGGSGQPQEFRYARSHPPKPHARGRKVPTLQERRFVEGVAQGKTDKEAALDAGYPVSIARNTKYKLWKKPQVQAYFQSMLRVIAPPERILRKMGELIDGKFLTTRRIRTLDDAGKLVTEVIEEIEIVNPSASLRATIEAAEWAGYIPTKRPEVTVGTLTQVHLQSDKKSKTEVVNMKRKPQSPRLSSGNANRVAGPHELSDGTVRAEEMSLRESDSATTKSCVHVNGLGDR